MFENKLEEEEEEQMEGEKEEEEENWDGWKMLKRFCGTWKFKMTTESSGCLQIRRPSLSEGHRGKE
jgi:hypothetical protein